MTQKSNSSNESYYQSRLRSLGISDALNTFEVPKTTGRENTDTGVVDLEVTDTMVTQKMLETDEEDNIIINYFRLYGSPRTWRKEGERTLKVFQRVRLKSPKVLTREDGSKYEMKYAQAAGSPLFPYFPPRIINHYLQATKIPVLYVVEGEFKALKGSLHELDIIGIPSIHGFYDGEVKGKLHGDIQELIIKCKVKKVVYLTDADTLTLKWAETKDLRKRASSFLSAVRDFRNSLQLLMDAEDIALSMCYFMHLRSSLEAEHKGLDDLLSGLPAKIPEIKKDLEEFDLARVYFSGKNLTDNRYATSLNSYFGIGSPEAFYEIYKKYIGNREFRFGKSRYQWDGEAVVHVRHENADKFFRVGDNWMKIIQAPNKNNELEEEIIPFKITEITRDYKKHPDFIDQLQRYDAFCNVPNWNGTYQRKHGECYNVSNPLNHESKHGSIQHTIKYLKHVFGGSGALKEIFDDKTETYRRVECAELGDQFTVALDYLTLQFQRPMQSLPVPILVSKEQETGKTTFLNWLREIYGSNATILNNQQFQMQFNSHYISKFIIGLDEGFLDVEKKAEKEKLKQLATAKEVFLERKGIDLKKFPYYGKLIICSNDADKVMGMDDEDRRWFVVKVPKLSKDEKDPFLEDKIKAEIPAWLDFIKSRQVFHKKETSLWFRTEYIITEQFLKVVEVTKSRIDQVVENFLKDHFLLYRDPVIRMDLNSMLEIINDPKISKYKVDGKDLNYYLTEKKGLKRGKNQRFDISVGYTPEHSKKQTISKHGRPFEFRYEEWLNAEEQKEFLEPLEFGNDENQMSLVAQKTVGSGKKEDRNKDMPF